MLTTEVSNGKRSVLVCISSLSDHSKNFYNTSYSSHSHTSGAVRYFNMNIGGAGDRYDEWTTALALEPQLLYKDGLVCSAKSAFPYYGPQEDHRPTEGERL